MNSGENASSTLLECEGGSLKFSDVFFGCGDVHNDIFPQIVYILAKLHVHEYSLYYHANSGIYCHNAFLRFTRFVICTGWYLLDRHKLYTTFHGN